MSRSLFDDDEVPPLAARLAPRLRTLAERGVYFGTSSWKYEGWLGSIYNRERYISRGKFSHKKFEAECLREYAETFPIVGGDFSFYRFPTPDDWARIFTSAPSSLAFGLKIPEDITVARWPGHARYGGRAGRLNEHFLNAALLETKFLKPLESYRRQAAVLIFEFGQFSRADFSTPADFLPRLERFLAALPDGWPYAIEIRNAEYATSDYFAVLARYKVAHIFNAWTRMPLVADQIAIPEAFGADFCVVRALLRKDRSYEKAVSMFEPYREVQEPDHSTRAALRHIAARALQTGQRAYIFVNNRLEGNSPGTIEAIVSSDL